ncbi:MULTISPECIES: hypothetical protein [unclassified Microcoleus]|uniref:hypothetical protein n=1 Tax=unclassified Microcoleus TaxID=2642155 RepID=UPI002FD47D20
MKKEEGRRFGNGLCKGCNGCNGCQSDVRRKKEEVRRKREEGREKRGEGKSKKKEGFSYLTYKPYFMHKKSDIQNIILIIA